MEVCSLGYKAAAQIYSSAICAMANADPCTCLLIWMCPEVFWHVDLKRDKKSYALKYIGRILLWSTGTFLADGGTPFMLGNDPKENCGLLVQASPYESDSLGLK